MMNDITYKRLSETRIKLASAICEQYKGKFDNKSKGKLISILAKIGIKNTMQMIFDFVQNHPDNCDGIIALSKFKDKEIINYFLEQLKSSHTLHRDLIVECLGEMKLPELVAEIKPYLADEDRQVRFQAAYALYNIGGKDAALAMCDYISDPDEWISMTILRLLCKMRELDSIPILIEKYHKDTDLRRKALMISFLARFKSITLLTVFDDAMQARDARLRANAIEAIGDLKLPVEELRKRVVPNLNDPNNRIRANAILAMAKIAPDKVKNQIIEMCNSDDIQLRRSAAFILCMIPPTDFLKEAEKLIVDENESVRKRMIQSLKNFPPEFISGQINKVLSDKNKWIRKYAVDMVSTIPAFDAAPIINLLRNERSAPNIAACLEFLAKHPTEKASSAIRLHYKDKRLPVVKALLKAIVAMEGVEGAKTIAPRLEMHDPIVVQTYTSILLESGNLEALDEFLVKLAKTKTQVNLDLLVPALSTIVDIVVMGENMPTPLLKRFSMMSQSPMPQRPYAPQDIAVQRPAAPQNVTAPKPVVLTAQPKQSVSLPPVSPAAPVAPAAPVPQQPVTEIDLGEVSPGMPSLDLGLPDLNLSLDTNDLLDISGAPEQTLKKKAAPAPHYKAGVKAYNLGKYKKGIEELRKSLNSEEAPKNIKMYLGIMLYEEGEYKEAAEFLEAYTKIASDNAKCHYLLGKCYRHNKEWEKLISVYQLFVTGELECSPNAKKRIHQDMGVACAILGRNENAVRMLTNLVKLEPDNAEIRYYLAMALYKMKKVSEAQVMIEQAAKHAPEGKSLTKQIASLAQTIRSGAPL